MKIMSRDFSTTHRQQLSQSWRISVLHLGPQGVSYSFCGARSRAQILLFQNASYSLNYISVGSWGPLTSLSSVFLPEESLYVDWLVHYDTKDHFFVKNRQYLSTVKMKIQRKLVLFGQEIMDVGFRSEWSHWTAAPYGGTRQKRHNTKLQCDAAR